MNTNRWKVNINGNFEGYQFEVNVIRIGVGAEYLCKGLNNGGLGK